MTRDKICGWLFLSMFSWQGASSECPAGDGPKPPFQIAAKHDTDRITTQLGSQRTVFVIRSPVGISQATIERMGDVWPEQVVLRFYLRGLESLQISTDQTKLNLSVSSAPGSLSIRQWHNDNERELLTSASPYWLKVQRVQHPQPASTSEPASDDYFEIQLPRGFHQSNPKRMSLSWIDFYRN